MMEESVGDFILNSNMSSHKSLEEIIAKNAKVSIPGPSSEERKKQTGQLIVRAKEASGHQSEMFIKGRDFYDVTAVLIVSAVKIIMEHELPLGNVLSPGQAFGKYQMLSSVAKLCQMEMKIIK